MFFGHSRIVLGQFELLDNFFLYAGGTFSLAGSIAASNIAKWNDEIWSQLSSDIFNGDVRALKFNGTKLYVGGEFTTIGGQTFNHIGVWDGSDWERLTGNGQTGFNGPVYAIEAYDGDLFFGGSFTAACGITSNRIIKWDKTSQSFTGSYFETGGKRGLNGTVRALAIGFHAPFDLISDTVTLYAGGSFTAAEDGTTGFGIIQRHDSQWRHMNRFFTGGGNPPSPIIINAISIKNLKDDSLDPSLGIAFVGGTFSEIADEVFRDWSSKNFAIYWGGAAAEDPGQSELWNIVGKDRYDYSPGLTFEGEIFSMAIKASGTISEPLLSLFIGGNFASVQGSGIIGPVNNIIELDLKTGNFSPLVSGGKTGTNGPVYAIAVDSSNNVYVGGGFTSAGDTAANRIAKWDGTVWSPLDTGMNDDIYSIELNPNTILGGGWASGGGGSLGSGGGGLWWLPPDTSIPGFGN